MPKERNHRLTIGALCVTVFASAFLVFQVQPIIARAILPWFGGTPSVWTTAMLFFQALLGLGYLYAHLLATRVSLRAQLLTQVALVVAALVALPILPAPEWRPTDPGHPTGRVLWLLLAHVGLPYLTLAGTGPLLQAWFHRAAPRRSPYRLYALSNLGSMLALLSYPLLVEPTLGLKAQGTLWAAGFVGFAVFTGLVTTRLWSVRSTITTAAPHDVGGASPRQWLVWTVLPLFASAMLLATTNHVCRNVAVVPFLWVVPLALYLATFIVAFDGPRWYSRPWFAGATLLVIVWISASKLLQAQLGVLPEATAYFTLMFFVCMLCHGELVRLKPEPRLLTSFYLALSLGGALGGAAVALVFPLLFNSYAEMKLGLVGGLALALGLLVRDGWRTWLGRRPALRWSLVALSFVVAPGVVGVEARGSVAGGAKVATRNFYGVLLVIDVDAADPWRRGRALMHGGISHGFQLLAAKRRREPTMYFGPQSGVGALLRQLKHAAPLNVGVLGLGVGTLATYGRQGDRYRFYEIDPAVLDLARRHFTFLGDSRASVDVTLGDARLSLEREPPQGFDVLVLDVFSGDAIPVHLLTREAFALYLRHLKPGGVIAAHISNRHLDLAPVVAGMAQVHGLHMVRVERKKKDDERAVVGSEWILLARHPAALEGRLIRQAMRGTPQTFGDPVVWTDSYSNLVGLLR